ncbi:MAG: twin-arginine translocase subunit TatC [Gemmatimonadaceae bacterium]|nr:twin-arginine translocase subunit TatC [Gloeobacterales cyanobacterium ES-bin-141]
MTVSEQDPQQEDELPDGPEPEDEFPGEVEMTLTEHLDELRIRLFYVFGTLAVAVSGCFVFVNPVVEWLQRPAGAGVEFIQTTPGEYFWVSFKVAGYCGLMLAAPMILYQLIRFVLPGLSRREQKFLVPIVLGSSVLFVVGVAFAYWVMAPAALSFFSSYGAEVVKQTWTIEKYFDLVLVMLLSTGIVFQLPVLQVLLGVTGIVTSERMFGLWRYVAVFAVALGAVVTPSTDPFTQIFLAGAVTVLYFGGAGTVRLLGK